MGTLISPRMLGSLTAFYPSLCTIQQNTPVADSYGQPIAAWANLAGHVGLACAVMSGGGREMKLPNQTYTVASHVILLAGHYPTITTAMRAVVGGVNYDILSVESDSQSTMTRLACQVVT